MRFLTAALLALALCSCASTQERNTALYQANVQAARQSQQDKADRLAAQQQQIQAAGAKCTSDTCAVAVAGFAAMLGATQNGSDHAQNGLPAPPYERDGAAKARDWIGALATIALPLANAAVAWHQSDAATEQMQAQYGFLDSVLLGSVNGIRDVGIATQASAPRITVGNDYITGSQHIGDATTGDGNATRGSHAGAGRDSIGGDRNSDSVLGNDNRINSPGPYDCASGSGGNGGSGGAVGEVGGEPGAPGAPGGVGGACSQGG